MPGLPAAWGPIGGKMQPSYRAPYLARVLVPRLPFFYGWVVLGCVCLAGFARQGPAVAVLAIFLVPMTTEFGWSRMAIAGAVSGGGLLAAFVSPLIGPVLDRRGARLILCCAVLGTGLATMALSLVHSLAVFYLLFCFARLNWAGPFELGLYGALNNWFVARRAVAASIATLAQTSGLVALPLIAQYAMQGADGQGGDWRDGWVAVGATVLIVGFVPTFLLLVRTPEDVGLLPDRNHKPGAGAATATPVEPRFSRAAAMRTPAFWLLSLYTMLVYPVQAGVSLHQVPHLIERGLAPAAAATVISVFWAMSAVASFGIGFLPRRWPVRYGLLAAALAMSAGSFALIAVDSLASAYAAGGLFGMGVGAMLTLIPVAWADYFGRESFGAIRSLALSVQVVAQAIGPVLSGALRDWSGTYTDSLVVFGCLAALAIGAALAARPARAPAAGSA
jgi:OFA family oxalate/formate antiporter-like MFS transporter